MHQIAPQLLKTASGSQSLWNKVGEHDFRKNIAELGRVSGSVPCDAKANDLDQWGKRLVDAKSQTLDLGTERTLADDLAFIAVYAKEAKTVSAVAVEELRDGQGLIISLAANQGVALRTQDAFRSIFQRLSACASRSQ